MILIDIEMPEKCGSCPCFHAENPMYCQLIKPPDRNKQIVAPYGLPRPEWCPLKEQEDLGTELTNAMELIHKKNERIKKLEEQIETLTKWRMNAGAFD